jgi:phosphopentomutase
MARVFLTVLDSVGCGGALDAAAFGDAGSNTLGHIVQACAAGRAEVGRSGPLNMPNLDALGLGAVIRLSTGIETPGLAAKPTGRYGAASEISRGKDTPSGHWEMAGLPVPWDWTYFPNTEPAFPQDVVDRVCALAGVGGILGNCHASGIPIINKYAAEHIRTGWPICYTSVDSVFQIAAHEEHFGLERLLNLCRDLAPMLHEMRVGRVIALKPGSTALRTAAILQSCRLLTRYVILSAGLATGSMRLARSTIYFRGGGLIPIIKARATPRFLTGWLN